MSTKRLLKILSDAKIISQDFLLDSPNPCRGVTILGEHQFDCPQRGQIISSDDGQRYCITRNNKVSCNITDIVTGERLCVRAGEIVLVKDYTGPHWHLQRTRNKGISLDKAMQGAMRGRKDLVPPGMPGLIEAPSNINKVQTVSAVESEVPSDYKLQVLTDEAGHKLAQKIYKNFISSEEFADIPQFIIDLDNLITKYRGDKPITEEEIDELADELEEEDEASGAEKVEENLGEEAEKEYKAKLKEKEVSFVTAFVDYMSK